MSHSNLENYYQITFSMIHHYNYSLTEIENMVVFEKDIYLTLIMNTLNKE